MRPSNKSRSRNKSGNSNHGNGGGGNNNNPRRTMGNIINRVFESAGPDGKVRGTPQQIIDKYQALARDAQVSGDRVVAENYLQHSEHYSRLLGEAQREQGEQRFNSNLNRDESQRDDDAPDFQRDAARQPQAQPQQHQPRGEQPSPVASGLVMIEPEDSDDFGGPIETPEGNARRVETPAAPSFAPVEPVAPVPVAPVPDAPRAEAQAPEAPVVEPAVAPAEPPAPAEAAAPVKRPRTRRKAKVEPEADPVVEAPQPADPF
ncbi:DUF4167 domain-containing protein [uncultured Amaricoccus sp.]|uniref:DUF4167 domain-containing protein n=1 Tax=uncultured Amaricoccus sp. TaxID=339341 RepID=UPI002615AB2E|nr:DUF4167 domain-containing protein [uncultured Amaricoccus sp.]